jgi:hypothetical protein
MIALRRFKKYDIVYFRRCHISIAITTIHRRSYLERRSNAMNDIEALPEFRAYQRLKNFLNSKIQGTKEYDWIRPPSIPIGGYTHEMNATQTNITIDAALITFCLHVEARIASMIGAGFYTIGPCGEEALSSVGLCLKPYDSLALHYRHGGVNICRQIVSNQSPRNEIILRLYRQ